MKGRTRPTSSGRPVVSIPAGRLPAEAAARETVLKDYFHEWRPRITSTAGENVTVSVDGPPRADYYVDPKIKQGLDWWSSEYSHVKIKDVYEAHLRKRNVGLSLSDAWTLHTFASALKDLPPDQAIVVLHADDHDDLQSPRLSISSDKDTPKLTDLITGKPVDVTKPASVASAITSGAIGMGSFLLPLLASRLDVSIRHLRQKPARNKERADGQYRLLHVPETDTLLDPTAMRPVVKVEAGTSLTGQPYLVTDSLSDWLSNISEEAAVLLHVDCDYFNNRYDGDSDYADTTRRFDPDADAVQGAVANLLTALEGLDGRLLDAHIGLSPGFFPAEHWPDTVASLVAGLAPALRKPRTQQNDPPKPPNVTLQKGSGGTKTGGEPGGAFWWVLADGAKAGKVWINMTKTRGQDQEHPSLSIALPKRSQSRGIGTQAYRLAAEASGHDVVWLHMRKSNEASRRAAEKAGFVVVDVPEDPQLVMRWTRSH